MNQNNTSNSTNNINSSIITALKSELSCTAQAKPAKGFKQVGSKYAAQIGIGKQKIHLGMFNTPEEATTAYQAAKARVAELRQQQEQQTSAG